MADTNESAIHAAVCQAVAILNVAPDVARLADGRRVHSILREALANYAMDKPVTDAEIERMRKGHRNDR